MLSFIDLSRLVPFDEGLDKMDALGLLKAQYTSPVSTDTGLNESHILPPISVEFHSLPFALSVA